MQQADNKPSLQHSDTPSVKRSWWHRWVLIFGCLNLLVLISSLVNYLTVKLGLVNTTGTITYWLALKGQFPTWYPIVVFAPFIIWFGRRFPIDRHRWQRALVVHVTLSVLFTILLGFTNLGSGPSQSQRSVYGPKVQSTGPRTKINPYTVLLDWISLDGIKVATRENYRDYERVVLSRKDGNVEERLFLDPKTGFPVKLDRLESHYLWGQVRVEYVYSDWIRVENLFIPAAVFQVTDGETTVSRTIGKVELVTRDKAPDLALPESAPKGPDRATLMKEVNQTKTVQVTPSTYLLVSRAYTEMVTLIDGTVYLLDATSSEDRARTDADYIKQLFPGNHPVVVVVTDLAWPHIAGVRYWVAQGATIVSHKASHDFLTKVVERRWTLEPDSLEKNRKNVKLKFVGIDSKHELAGGKLQLYPIDGIASECALMAYIADEHLLWASDYIQNLRSPSAYATEVMTAVQRAGIQPKRVAAEHIPLSEWAKIVALQGSAN